MSFTCNLCQKLNISKINFKCFNRNKNNSKPSDEISFDLIDSVQQKFKEIIPSNENYLYIKILSDGYIISVAGLGFNEFPIDKSLLNNKKIDDVTIYNILFFHYIKPLFLLSIEKGDAYQFDFSCNKSKFTCSIYPCSIPKHIISSCDIIIRYHHEIVDLTKYKLNKTTNLL